MLRALPFLLLLPLFACSSDPSSASDAAPDTSHPDAAVSPADAAPSDASEVAPGDDAGPADAGAPGPDAALDLPDSGAPDGGDPSLGPCGRAWDLTVSAPYAIEGTWFFGRKDPCAWQDALEQFHRVGGKWIWQFGPELEPRTAADLKADPDFAACAVGSKDCVQDALDDLGASRVAGFLTYGWDAPWASVVDQCPTLDKTIAAGAVTYHRLVLPSAASQGSCPTSGQVYVLLTRSDGSDSEQGMLSAADALSMKVIMAMPAMPHSTSVPWKLEPALLPATLEWARRVFLDQAARAAPHPSFEGVYQTFETPLSGSSYWDDEYAGYGALAAVFHSVFPDKVYALSPYWDLRAGSDLEVSDVQAGAKALALQGVDVLAPQDGRGTGKAALYWPYEKDKLVSAVDPLLALFAGSDVTFAEAYKASTTELYAAVRAGLDEAASSGAYTRLWANLEAFEPVAQEACSYAADGRTTKARIDRAVTLGTRQVEHVISFMFDPFFTCVTAGMPVSLADEIEADALRPLVNRAYQTTSSFTDGIMVRGYHVAEQNPRFSLTWYDASWQAHTEVVAPDWTNPTWGAANDGPDHLQAAFVPFSFTNLAPSFWVHVRAINDVGSATETYSVGY